MKFAPCAVIPVFNHHRELPRLIGELHRQGLAAIVVDDGSGPGTRSVLDELAAQYFGTLILIRHQKNRGKGAAVLRGLRAASEAGWTHVVQIDADGQHDPKEVQGLLELARKAPHALVSGVPQYDDSVPWTRYYGRWLTHLLVWLETLSCEIKDSMCGFRVYPVKETLAVAAREHIGARMDFDTEAMVRLYLAGAPVHFLPVSVRYPEDGSSNFRMLRDNARMTWLHLRLIGGLLFRLKI